MPIIRTGNTPVVIPTATTNDPVITPAVPGVTPVVVAPIPGNNATTAAGLADAGQGGVNAAVTTLAGGNDVVGADGTMFPGVTGENLQAKLIELAMPAEPGAVKAAPFAGVTNPALLIKAAKSIEKAFDACVGQPPDEATGLAWRQLRASCLHLLEQAALRVYELKGDVKAILKSTIDVIKKEPNRALRDFAFENLIGHAEAKKLPEVKEARALLYPEAPPYAEWPKTVRVVRYCDDEGSKIEDNIWFFVEVMGAKHTANADGSHDFAIKKRGAKHDIEVHIPPKADGLNIVAPVGDGKTQVIEYCGHAGHGNFFEAALTTGAKGTGQGQVMAAYQCWGEGNTETLERQIPDLQYLSTTEMTSDNYDFAMQKRFFEGIMAEQTWDQMLKGTISDLKRDYKEDIAKGELKVDTHYLPPTNRGRLLTHYDRDGDGVRDGEDHIFNVIYPRRVDTSGGYDPVVQAVPRFALDGSELSKSVNALTLILRYDHVLAPADEAKVVWDPNKWQPGGFFEPKAGDLHAFQFTKTAAGEVRVALSTLFAQTSREDLQRMLAIETGLWLGKEAALPADRQGALAVTMLQRMVEGQGEWFSKEDGLLDEFWAEEQMLFSRYGLGGFSLADVTAAIGMSEHDDFLTKHFDKAEKFLKQNATGLSELGARNPTRVGKALDLPVGGISLLEGQRFEQNKVGEALKQLGIKGEVESTNPSWISMPMAATNMIVTVKDGDKQSIFGLGIDTTGTLLAAARLDFDFSKKIAGLLNAALARMAMSGGLSVRDASNAYEAAKKTNPDPLDAFAAAARSLRSAASPAATFDPGNLFYDLRNSGLSDQTKLEQTNASVTALFPSSYQIQAETALYNALSMSKELEKKMGPIAASFNQAVLAGNGDQTSWGKAAEVLRDAIPKKLTLAANADVAALLMAMENSAVLAGSRVTLTTALGYKAIDLAELALAANLGGSDAVPAAKVAMREAFKKTGDVVDAIIAGMDSSPGVTSYNFEGALQLDRFGVFPTTSPEYKVAVDKIAAHRAIVGFQEIVTRIVGSAVNAAAVEPAKKRYRDAIAAGDSVDVAIGKGVGALDKSKADVVISMIENMYGLPDGYDIAPIAAALAKSMGMTRAELVLTSRLGTLQNYDSGGNAAVMRLFRTAFVEAEKKTGSIVEALVAGANALLVPSFESSSPLLQWTSGSSCLNPKEAAEVQTKLATPLQMFALRQIIEASTAPMIDADKKRIMKAADKALLGAVDAAKPYEAAIAGLKAIKAIAVPVGAELGGYGLRQIEDAKVRGDIFRELIRLRGYSLNDFLREMTTAALNQGLMPSTAAAPDQQALKASIDAAFNAGLAPSEAILKAVRDFVAVAKSNVWIDMSDVGSLVDVPADFAAQLETARVYKP